MAERLTEEKRDDLSRLVLRRIYVEPSRYAEELRSRGVFISSGEPINVATPRSVQIELELLGVPKIFARGVATYTTQMLNRGGFPKIFPSGSGLNIEYANTDAGRLFRRNDLPQGEAARRYLAYEPLVKDKLKQFRARKTEVKKKESKGPSTAILRLIAPHSMDEFEGRARELKRNSAKNTQVEYLPLPSLAGLEINALGRLISREDARAILASGIKPEKFADLVGSLRGLFIHRIGLDEALAQGVVEDIISDTDKKLQNKGLHLDLYTLISRDTLFLIVRKLADQNTNPNLQFQIETIEPAGGVAEPFPRYLANIWGSRFDSETLGQVVEDIKAAELGLGEAVEAMLLDDESEKLCRELRLKGSVKVGDYEITKKQLEKTLGPILLHDELVVQAIFADIVGEIYPMPYRIEGDAREIALFSLRYIAGQFTLSEIEEVLSPEVSDISSQPQIITLNRQIDEVSNQLNDITGKDRQSEQRRSAVLKRRDQLVKRLTGLLRLVLAPKPVTGAVRQAILDKVPGSEPDEEKDPESFNLYQMYKTMTPEGWVKDWRSGRLAEKVYEVLRNLEVKSLFPKGVVSV